MDLLVGGPESTGWYILTWVTLTLHDVRRLDAIAYMALHVEHYS